ncbi:hypothetical protein WA158_000988 [Blastocystis sp. Blastoise]
MSKRLYEEDQPSKTKLSSTKEDNDNDSSESFNRLMRTIETNYNTIKELRENKLRQEKEYIEEKSKLTQQIQESESVRHEYFMKVSKLERQIEEMEQKIRLYEVQKDTIQKMQVDLPEYYSKNMETLKNEYTSLNQRHLAVIEENKQLKLQLLNTNGDSSTINMNTSLNKENKLNNTVEFTTVYQELSQERRLKEKYYKESEACRQECVQLNEEIRTLKEQMQMNRKNDLDVNYAVTEMKRVQREIEKIELFMKQYKMNYKENEIVDDFLVLIRKNLEEKQSAKQTEHVNSLKTEIQEMKNCLQEREKNIISLMSTTQENSRQIDYLNLKNNTLLNETKTLTNIIQSFGAYSHGDPNAIQGIQETFKKLEEDMNHTQSLLTNYDSTSKDTNENIKSVYILKYNQLQQEKKDLEEKVEKLEKQVENTETQLVSLKASYISGGIDVTTTKILHLKENPINKYKQEKEMSLEKENKELKVFIEKLQKDSTACLASPLLLQQQQELKKEKETAEKRFDKLKEIFTSNQKKFKDAVYCLTGYKIELVQDNGQKWIVKHVYNDRPADSLMFEVSPDGTFSLMETEFTKCISRKTFAYLHTCNSFPAFLASLCLELFEKQSIY